MQPSKNHRIIISLWTFPVGGLLGTASLLLRGPLYLPNIDPVAWAATVTSDIFTLTQAGVIIAYALPFFGFWALYAILANKTSLEKVAFYGFMASIIGTALAMPTLGMFSFASPLLAERYLQGDTQLPTILTQIATTGVAAAINLLGGSLYLLGTVLLGIAIWRSQFLPKWNGLLLALHGLFLVFGFAVFPLLLLGWVFLAICGGWILFSSSAINAPHTVEG